MTVETIPRSSALEHDELEALVKVVDLVCVTDVDRDTLVCLSHSLLDLFNTIETDSL